MFVNKVTHHFSLKKGKSSEAERICVLEIGKSLSQLHRGILALSDTAYIIAHCHWDGER